MCSLFFTTLFLVFTYVGRWLVNWCVCVCVCVCVFGFNSNFDQITVTMLSITLRAQSSHSTRRTRLPSVGSFPHLTLHLCGIVSLSCIFSQPRASTGACRSLYGPWEVSTNCGVQSACISSVQGRLAPRCHGAVRGMRLISSRTTNLEEELQ